MLDFKEKRKVKRILYSKITVILLAMVFIFLANGVFGVYKKARIAFDSRNRTADDLADLKEREGALLVNIEKLKTGRGVESEIREKFGVVKDGEEVVIIVDSERDKVENGTQGPINLGGVWQRLISIFK